MPFVYSLGSVIGPAIGGYLANPYKRKPGDASDADGRLFWKFPYALPSMVGAGFFLAGITIGLLFLEETLGSRRHLPDHGLFLGRQVAARFHVFVARVKKLIWRRPLHVPTPATPISTRAKSNRGDAEPGSRRRKITNEANPTWNSVLTPETVVCLSAYTFLHMHSAGFDQIISVFMHHPSSGPSVGETVPPFRFNKGFGMGKQKRRSWTWPHACNCILLHN
jgi:MFS family permease